MATLDRVLLYCSVHQTLKVLLSLVPFSIVQRPELVFEEREATVMAPSLMCDSAILPCLRGCLAFLRRHFPPQSPPSCSLGPSPCRQQQTSPWDFSPIPMIQLPAAALSRGLAYLCGVCMALARIVYVILIPFILSQISWCTLQQPQMFLLCFKQLPWCGDLTLLQFPQPLGASPVLFTLFSPTSFVLLSFV